MLDLNTRVALVVKMLPDGTFSSIWINREDIRTLFQFMKVKGKVCIRAKWPTRPELIPVSVA